jgi:predicted transcriptional regulator
MSIAIIAENPATNAFVRKKRSKLHLLIKIIKTQNNYDSPKTKNPH